MLRNPLRKVERSWNLPITFILMHVIAYLICVPFVFPFWKPVEFITCLSLFGVSFLLWVRVLLIDPGFIKKPKDIDFIEVLQLIDPI